MSSQSNPVLDVQGPSSVGTDYLGCLTCPVCLDEFIPSRKDQVNCTKRCANKAAHQRRDEMREYNKELRAKLVNIAFAYLHRDCFIGFDGQYEGPLNKSITLVVKVRKDTGYHASPHADHCKPAEAKFNSVTVEDHDWVSRQKSFPHSQSMPRSHNSLCTTCCEMVVDGANPVRVTRGVYLPINHDCAVRVYDLAGKLLETKQL